MRFRGIDVFEERREGVGKKRASRGDSRGVLEWYLEHDPLF